MDVLETIIEERNQIHECLTSCDDNLKQYQEYLRQLKDNLDETQLYKSQTTETLEINNLTKTVFNEDYKEIKLLVGKIYRYIQQLEETLAKLTQNETVMEKMFAENTEHLKTLESSVLNKIQLLELKEKGIRDRTAAEHKNIQEEINLIDKEFEECEKIWKTDLDKYEEQQKTLDCLKVETEILQDNIDCEVQQQDALLQETRDQNRIIIEEMKNSMELNDRILEAEKSILEMTGNLQEILVNKEKLTQQQNEGQRTLQELDKECDNLEKIIDQIENDHTKRYEIINKEIEEKINLTRETEIKLETSQKKTDEINKAIEELNSKIKTLDEELLGLHENAIRDNDYIEKNQLSAISEETENLKKKSEYLEKVIFESRNEVNKYQEELNKLMSTPNIELQEYQEKIRALEAENKNHLSFEKEIEEIDLENKKLQQTVEQHQIAIKDYSSQKIQMELELEANKKELKTVTMQCDNVEKEILRLEAFKEEKVKLFPKPPLKRTRPSTQTRSKKKSNFAADAGSDSSVDGERLSYAEFMAKKRMMQDKNVKS